MVEADTLLPHRASVMSSTRRTDTPARYISMRASSTLLYPAAVTLDNSSLKRDSFERGTWSVTVPGGGGQVSVIVTAAVALTGLAALVAG